MSLRRLTGDRRRAIAIGEGGKSARSKSEISGGKEERGRGGGRCRWRDDASRVQEHDLHTTANRKQKLNKPDRLPSGFVKVSEVLQEVLPLPLVGDGVLVEDLGHVRG